MLGNAALEGRATPKEPQTTTVRTRPLRLALLPDYREENWPSMDLCADMLRDRLQAESDIDLASLCPEFRRRFGAMQRGWAINADRFLNRHWDYPRHLRAKLADYDVFHICDHSYAQLALELPEGRTGIFCHDLDTFRSLLQPALEPRPFWFRWMMQRVLKGFRRAALVFHTTLAVRQEILSHGLAPPERLVHAPLGHADEFTAEPPADPEADRILGSLHGPYLLHVGSCIPRKRVDFLLELFALLRQARPGLHLVKVGGVWTDAHQELIRRHQMHAAIVHVTDISRSTLACLYRRAELALLPSDAEGFGLPVVEALACGTRVLASDLPVLREVGGDAVNYAAIGALPAWRDEALRLLADPAPSAGRDQRLERARQFSWAQHARIIADAYRGLLA
jgi:glycosyltransferase involved in cell wall biosynthesis